MYKPKTPNDEYIETLKGYSKRLRNEKDPLRYKLIEREQKAIRDAIFNNILNGALALGITELSINPAEIISTSYDHIKHPKAVWDLADSQGIGFGCMDVNQSAVHHYIFSKQYIGKWDTATKTKIGEPDRLIWEAT